MNSLVWTSSSEMRPDEAGARDGEANTSVFVSDPRGDPGASEPNPDVVGSAIVACSGTSSDSAASTFSSTAGTLSLTSAGCCCNSFELADDVSI